MKKLDTGRFVGLGLIIGAMILFFGINRILSSEQYRQNRMFNPGEFSWEQPARSARAQAGLNAGEADLGLQYLQNTAAMLPNFVGAKINCTNCHLNGGQTPGAAPWVNIESRFPQFRHRTGADIDLVDRINDCFERSLNGKPLPRDHKAMKAILAYMKTLNLQNGEVEGRGIEKLKLGQEPDPIHGEKVYQAKCAQCHQVNGQGLFGADGIIIYPPLWGDKSFNIGAGMARLHTAAGFAKHNMPLGQGNSISDVDAWDVAFYFTRQARPDYAKKNLDWPKGHKPEDARY